MIPFYKRGFRKGKASALPFFYLTFYCPEDKMPPTFSIMGRLYPYKFQSLTEDILIKGCIMVNGEELDQFQLLEEKIGNLIEYVRSLKQEKESLKGQVQTLEEKNAALRGERDQLRQEKDTAKSRIGSLLEKMEQIDL
jgi:FtsZ-binding cell division protein ZapB